MSKATDLIAQCKATGDWAPLADAIPYAKFLGISIEHMTDGLVGKMSFTHHLIGNPTLPALHGGTLGALLESTAIFQLLWEAETVVLPKTINITVDYLHTGRPVDTYARGIITKQGRRVVNVRAEAWQEDRTRPIASANAHFLIL
ncbi:MAG: PaaI family thioesterase [Sandaracinaceae bacterium]|nr:PaaI family thioesterase [Sandaracinaceae bacterium]